jgi:acetyltransferase-like isoleucine patch superfamily enzyme
MQSLNMKNEMPKFVCLKSHDERVEIGNYTYGFPNFKLWSNEERITIGSYCSISRDVDIFGGGEHITDWVTTFPLRIAFNLKGAWEDGLPNTKGPTIIGNDVWIGDGAKILSGVTVGDGAVLGAGAVVSKSIPPYAIAAGNPARVIKYRFNEKQICQLMQIKWWNWSVDKIQDNVELLSSKNINDFIQKALKDRSEGNINA